MKSKKLYCFLASIILILCGWLFLNNQLCYYFNPLNKVSSYKIYYSKIDEHIVSKIEQYDMVILESLFLNKQQIEEIKNKDTKIFGYVSIVEVGAWDKNLTKMLNSEDYLKINDTFVYGHDKNNYVGNLLSENYKEALYNIISQRIVENNLDGIFLDTIDLINKGVLSDDDSLINDLSNAYIVFLKELKNKFPELLLIQNRGFDSFLNGSYNLVDGILWEDFDKEDFSNPYYNDILDRVIRYSKKGCVTIFTVSFKNKGINYEYSNKLGFKYLFHPIDSLYDNWSD